MAQLYTRPSPSHTLLHVGRYPPQPVPVLGHASTLSPSFLLAQSNFEPNFFPYKYQNISRTYSFFTPTFLWRWKRQSVPKRWHIKFRHRGITQKKAYNRWQDLLICRPTKRFRTESIASVLLIVLLLIPLRYVRSSVSCLDCNQIVAMWTHRMEVVLLHSGLISWSQWPHVWRRGCAAACLLGLRFRIQQAAWMSVSCVYCVLSGRSLWVELVTCPEESYCLWCVWVWSLDNEETLAHEGLLRLGKKIVGYLTWEGLLHSFR
jgi:hypothetical protein